MLVPHSGKNYKDWLKEAKAQEERCRPHLPMLAFDAQAVLRETVRNFDPQPPLPVHLFFSKQDNLACIQHWDDQAVIFIHVLLNHPTTPLPVYRHIILHELVHLAVPPETVKGREVAHPPAFWEMEARVCPDRSRVWAWVHFNFDACLQVQKRKERILVRRKWTRFYGKPGLAWGAPFFDTLDRMAAKLKDSRYM